MNKTLWRYRHLVFQWHSQPFSSAIQSKPNLKILSSPKHCFHMLESGVRITASTLSPKQCLYCFITVQWVKFKIAYCCLELWVVCITHGHNYCPPGLKSLADCSGKENCEHSWYGRICLPDLKRMRLTDQSSYKRIVKALRNATQMCSVLSMWPPDIKRKKTQTHTLQSPKTLQGKDKRLAFFKKKESHGIFISV